MSDLFAGPGEVRALARALDWAATPLGPPEGWPPALRTAARLMLDSPLATSLWCGPAYVLLYNDAYRRLLDAKHPAALGRSGAAVWDELWAELEPQFAGVRAGGAPVLRDDALLVMARLAGGRREEAWFSYSLAALRDEAGAVLAVHNVAVETTGRVRARREVEAARDAAAHGEARLRALFRQLPSFVSVVRGPTHVLEFANDAYFDLVGRRDILGKPVWEALPDARDQGFEALLDGVLATGEPVVGRAAPLQLVRTPGAAPELRYIDFVYLPLVEPDGTRSGVMGHGTDVTGHVLAQREVERLLDEGRASNQALQIANAQLQDQQVELELSNQQLQEQAAELEAANEELRETTEALARQTEAAEAERARATGILETTADAYFALDAEFRIVEVNAAMERGSDMPRDQLVGRVFWTLFPGALGTDFERYYRRAATERVAAHFTHDYSDGRLELVVDVDAYPAPGGGIAVFWRDVTARVRAEAAVRASEAKYRSLFESIDQGLCIIEVLSDAEGRPVDYRFLETNPVFVAQTGLADAVGRTARELVPGLEAHWFATYGRVAATGEPTRFQQGSEAMGRWFDVYAFRVGAPADRQVAVLFSDVTAARAAAREREALLAESEAARAAAESASRARSDFLAVMSHELRTPLNAIGGYAELMAMGIRGPLTPQLRDDLQRIQTSQRHLLGLINEVLNYARIETGVVHYDVADVELGEVVASVEPLIAPQLGAKRLAYAHDGCGHTPAVARADRDKVRQVLLNLLSNAIKFTEPGGRIEVACDASPVAAEGGRVLLRVRDTGVGIPPDQQERVFEPFVQVDARLTRPHEGTGLGLAISRDLARGMGGDLTLESEPGAGSTFTLALPAGTAAPDAPAPDAPAPDEAPPAGSPGATA